MAIPRNLGNLAPGVDTNGVLQPTKGGTGATTLTANNVILGNGTSAVQFVAPGTTGNILVSNGTTWTSTAPAASGAPVGSLQYFSGTTTPDSTWLYCSGDVFAKSTYTALSTAIGNIPNNFSASASGSISLSGLSIPISPLLVNNGTAYYTWFVTEVCGSYQNQAWTSTTGTTWTTLNVTAPGRSAQDLIYANSIFVAISSARGGLPGTSNLLRTSTNFNTWTTRTVTTTELFVVRYLNSLFVTAGAGGFLATSTDAITWTARTSGTTSSILALTYGNGLYAYAGDGGMIATSTDAITWTARTSNTTATIVGLAYGNNRFVTVGQGYNGTSTDGITWINSGKLGNTNSNFPNSLVYGYGNLFYSIGSNFTALYSADGNNWQTYTDIVNPRTVATATNRVMFAAGSSNSLNMSAYNPFTYNTTTQFALPAQAATLTTQNGITNDKLTSLYIKAS